eukprot:749277-Hanusia_phi.AAC.5
MAEELEALRAFACPISLMLMSDPVTAFDGHTYERSCIESWLESNNTSPLTGAVLPSKHLFPNFALRSAIEEWHRQTALLIDRSDIEIEQGPIASGSFKTLYKGYLRKRIQGVQIRRIEVAVLKVRQGDGGTEAGVLLKLGRHPRLVQFLGHCMLEDSRLLVTEFAKFGSVCDALEGLRGKVQPVHQLVMMQQIAQGMQHLAEKGVVHRDLAARNVLLFEFDERDVRKTSVKVTDLGLAKELVNCTHATLMGDELPYLYMPPESIQHRKFSEKSDVWAFGVTCWEILTWVKVPYYNITQVDEVIRYVVSGGRLSREEITGECPDTVWNLMDSCWRADARDRPTFSELVIALGFLGSENYMEQVQRNTRYLEELVDKETELTAEKAKYAVTQNELQDTKMKLLATMNELKDAKRKLATDSSKLSRISDELKGVKEQLVNKEAELAVKRKEFQDINAELSARTNDLNDTRNELSGTKIKLQGMEKSLDDTKKDLFEIKDHILKGDNGPAYTKRKKFFLNF